MERIRFKSLLLSVLCFVCLLGCNNISSHSERTVDVNAFGWLCTDTLEVKIANTDTLSLRDLGLILKVSSDYKATEFACNIVIQSPDSVSVSEDIDFVLDNSQLVYNELGMREYLIKYRKNVCLEKTGNYIFKFAPNTAKVKGIWAVGVKIDLENG